MKSLNCILACALAAATVGSASAQVWRSDQGDGTFRNPVLYADYPDPDIIRVGEDYYFATTTFVNVPGITILHSKDLVNWRLLSHVVDRLEGMEQYDLKNGNGYRRGLFATSLRHHRGKFYLAVTPVGLRTRIYYAADPKGPWKFHQLDRAAFDPALFIDSDGTPYMATAIGSDGTVTLLTLKDDLSGILASRQIHYNRGAEGSKIIKRAGWYYMFNAIPRRLGLTVSRARSLSGPWETRDQIDDTTGGHQGALVDLPDGSWFGYVMVDAGSIGRMTNFSPVFWKDDWPIWGTPEAPGRVPDRARKPIAGHPFVEPATSDDFRGAKLSLQWQWNHNPEPSRWSLTERRGYLRLRPTVAPDLWSARNTLTQKTQGPASRAVVKLDISRLGIGDRCGFGTFGQYTATIAASRSAQGKPILAMTVIESSEAGPKIETRVSDHPINGKALWIAADVNFKTDRGTLSYSLDGRKWHGLGGEFPLAFAWRTGTFQGEQFAISCYNPGPSKGWLDVDSYTLSPGKP